MTPKTFMMMEETFENCSIIPCVHQSRQVKSSVEIRQELPELEVFKVNSIVLHWIWVAAQSVSQSVS